MSKFDWFAWISHNTLRNIVKPCADQLLYDLMSLVTIRMNDIFLCVAFYGQKLILFCTEIEIKITTSDEDEIGKIFEQVIFSVRFNHFWLVIIHK